MFVEADFLREYGIDLSLELGAMTWRRFLVLLRGLSPQSATVTAMTSRVEFGQAESGPPPISTPEGAQSAFVAIYGREKSPA